jgi:hypothetical protein
MTAQLSNAALILGVAGATPNVSVMLSGIAGLAVRFHGRRVVSMRSQREMFEYQIGLERDELNEYPAEEAEELALIYAARAFEGEAKALADRLIADPDGRWTPGSEELGLNPDELARLGWRPSPPSCPSPSARPFPWRPISSAPVRRRC